MIDDTAFLYLLLGIDFIEFAILVFLARQLPKDCAPSHPRDIAKP